MEKERKTPTQEVIERFEKSIQGSVLTTTHPEYDMRRNDRSLLVDAYPFFIVRVKNQDDVIKTVQFAKENRWPLAVRSGGHSTRSLANGHQSVLVDVTEMNQIEIDVENKTAKIETGATWGEVAGALQPYNLALTSGDNATVGVGGLSQGSGIGYMVRKYGLTSDRIRSADLVTADGEPLHVSADENVELFWGFRGGAGNFGVATAIEFNLHEGGEVIGGTIFYQDAKAEELYELVRLANEAPTELTVMMRIMQGSKIPSLPKDVQSKKIIAINFCYTGDLATGEAVLAPFRQVGTLVADTLHPQPYTNLMEAHAGRRGYTGQSAYMRVFDLERAALLTDIVNEGDSPLSPAIGLRVLGGAVAEKSPETSAYSHRHKPFLVQVHNFYMTEDQAPITQQILADAWEKMAPFSEGVDPNIIGNQGPIPLTDIYAPDTLRRLVQLKQQYDPENRLNQNLNIPPDLKVDEPNISTEGD